MHGTNVKIIILIDFHPHCSLLFKECSFFCSCRGIFKQFEILPVLCQYILSLMNVRKIFKQI